MSKVVYMFPRMRKSLALNLDLAYVIDDVRHCLDKSFNIVERLLKFIHFLLYVSYLKLA